MERRRVHVGDGPDVDRGVLLYVEDDAAIAAMTVEVLSDAYQVDHAATGEEGLRRALARRYDVMVVDRRLPGMDGIAFVRAVRTARITTPILMLTALGSVDDRVSGLDGGANDYLVKPFDYDELLARLRSLRRGFEADAARRRLGEWTFTPESQALYDPSGYRIALTATETALLELLSGSPEHVFTREEILRSVFREGETTSSVDTYVHYVRRKSTRDIIDTVRARGYRAGNPS
jgi:DNA-binding response OmpR family regulator